MSITAAQINPAMLVQGAFAGGAQAANPLSNLAALLKSEGQLMVAIGSLIQQVQSLLAQQAGVGASPVAQTIGHALGKAAGAAPGALSALPGPIKQAAAHALGGAALGGALSVGKAALSSIAPVLSGATSALSGAAAALGGGALGSAQPAVPNAALQVAHAAVPGGAPQEAHAAIPSGALQVAHAVVPGGASQEAPQAAGGQAQAPKPKLSAEGEAAGRVIAKNFQNLERHDGMIHTGDLEKIAKGKCPHHMAPDQITPELKQAAQFLVKEKGHKTLDTIDTAAQDSKGLLHKLLSHADGKISKEDLAAAFSGSEPKKLAGGSPHNFSVAQH